MFKVYGEFRNQPKSIRENEEFSIEYKTNMNDAQKKNVRVNNVPNLSSNSVIGPMSEKD